MSKVMKTEGVHACVRQILFQCGAHKQLSSVWSAQAVGRMAGAIAPGWTTSDISMGSRCRMWGHFGTCRCVANRGNPFCKWLQCSTPPTEDGELQPTVVCISSCGRPGGGWCGRRAVERQRRILGSAEGEKGGGLSHRFVGYCIGGSSSSSSSSGSGGSGAATTIACCCCHRWCRAVCKDPVWTKLAAQQLPPDMTSGLAFGWRWVKLQHFASGYVARTNCCCCCTAVAPRPYQRWTQCPFGFHGHVAERTWRKHSRCTTADTTVAPNPVWFPRGVRGSGGGGAHVVDQLVPAGSSVGHMLLEGGAPSQVFSRFPTVVLLGVPLPPHQELAGTISHPLFQNGLHIICWFWCFSSITCA